ncbi:kinase-like domain-containing protein [Rhizophagus diaphanus]|nr:kinase-like domain-containing protein [Rhizophagus diaphanus] [Rhizophagus sp. MUCL 43196]
MTIRILRFFLKLELEDLLRYMLRIGTILQQNLQLRKLRKLLTFLLKKSLLMRWWNIRKISKNAITLKSEVQLKFAKEIASAILCLHANNIIHRDIHPNNILIHERTIKLADFGRSCLQGSDVDTGVFGVIPYVDPKMLDPKILYNLSKKSDIYSMGVILWQLTSCSSPFNFEK